MPSVNPPRFRATLVRLRSALFALSFAAASSSAACPFHTYTPERTAADWLIDGPEVVLARPDPQDPLAFRISEVIRSEGTPPDINILVPNDTTRRLLASPGDAVLLAHDGTTWRLQAYVDPQFKQVIRQVLEQAPNWNAVYEPERFEIFASLQNSADSDLQRLALSEIDKAPYAQLRRMQMHLSDEELLRDLWRPQAFNYQPIRVLLLGLAGSDAARDEVRAFLLRVEKWDWANNLGAFATAEIELNAAAGVNFLAQHYLEDLVQPLAKLEMVIEALAIQNGVAEPVVRAEISTTLRDFVVARPEGAALIARQFSTRHDWSQAQLLKQVMEEKSLTSAPDLLAVAIYVAQARSAVPARVLEPNPEG